MSTIYYFYDNCRVLKLFRQPFLYENVSSHMVKLNKKQIKWLVDQVVKHNKKPKEVAPIYNISERRVQQLVKGFKNTKKYAELNKNRRPKENLTASQKQLIDVVSQHHRVGARVLKIALDEDHPNNRISKNKIHEYLRSIGTSKPDKKKQRKPRKRCRYERKHSGSLVHSDTHSCKWGKKGKVMTVIDDASRKVLAAAEVSRATTHNAIKVMQEAIREAWKYKLLIKAVNTDRGTEFHTNTPGKKKKEHAYKAFLRNKGIKHIPSRVRNPQTNGKLERWHQEYERHRPSFKRLDEFVAWYNDRIHGELRTRPNRAFMRKLPADCLVGLMFGGEDEKTK